MTEHTPEPWEYDGGIVVRRDGVNIARLALNGSAIEVRGNGRLIAAAPDMEAVLEKVKRNAIAEHGRLMPGTILEVQAALTKAREG